MAFGYKKPTHFIDGSPIPTGYQDRLNKSFEDVFKAEASIDLDELDGFSKAMNMLNQHGQLD